MFQLLPRSIVGLPARPRAARPLLAWLVASIVLPAIASGQCRLSELEYLVPAGGATGDQFGFAVAMSEDLAVVGAALDDQGGTDAGSAVVYRDDGNSWVEEGEFIPGDAVPLDWFGYAVAIDKGVAVVGAPNKAVGSSNGAGAVYVYRRSETGWTFEQKLTAADAASSDYFGSSVAIKNRTILVGAPYADTPQVNSGAAYVFSFDGAIWTQSQKLVASDGAARDSFGDSVAIAWNVLLVGADGHDDLGEASGAAYLFRYDGNLWAEEQEFLPTAGGSLDRFGMAVSLRSDVAVVAAPYSDLAGDDAGAAFIYRHDGSGWHQEALLVAPSPEADDRFGTSVSVRGSALVVGAPGCDDLASEAGMSYLYHHDGNGWSLTRELVASDASAGDGFGRSVSVGGDLLIAGANLHDVTGPESGASYVYSALVELGLTAQPASVKPGDTLTFTSVFGNPGDPVGLVVVEANGVPMFRFMKIGAFGANHRWVLAGVVPPGYSGLNASFAAVGLTRCGAAGQSPPMAVIFQ